MPLVSSVQTLKAENNELRQELQSVKADLNEMKALLAQYGNDLQACCFKSEPSSVRTQTTANDGSANDGAPLSVSSLTTNGASLEQNVPNPFSQTTTISYYLPQNVANASIVITDLNGKSLQTHILNDRGAAQVTIDASTFAQGTYFYSLIIDGKTVVTKRMVTTGK